MTRKNYRIIVRSWRLPIDETDYVSIATACALSGLDSRLIWNSAMHFDPRVGDVPNIRSCRVQGRLHVRLGDVLLITGALADGREYR